MRARVGIVATHPDNQFFTQAIALAIQCNRVPANTILLTVFQRCKQHFLAIIFQIRIFLYTEKVNLLLEFFFTITQEMIVKLLIASHYSDSNWSLVLGFRLPYCCTCIGTTTLVASHSITIAKGVSSKRIVNCSTGPVVASEATSTERASSSGIRAAMPSRFTPQS